MVQTIYRQKVIEKNSTHLVFKGLMFRARKQLTRLIRYRSRYNVFVFLLRIRRDVSHICDRTIAVVAPVRHCTWRSVPW